MEKYCWEMRNFWDSVDYRYYGIKASIIMFKSIGIAPIGVTRTRYPSGKKNGRPKFVYSRAGLIYNVSLVLALSGSSFFILRRPYENDYPYKTELTTTIEWIQTFLSIVILVALWLTISTRQNKMVDLSNRLMEFESRIGGSTTYCRKSGSIGSSMLGIFVLNAIVWIFVIIIDNRTYRSIIIDWMSDIFPLMIASWFVLQYAMIVKILHRQYCNFNRDVVEASRPAVGMAAIASSLVTDRTSGGDFRSFSMIRRFRLVHNVLYEIASEITDFYSLPILLAISLSSFFIVYNTYYVIMPLVLEIDKDPGLVAVSSILWLVGLTLPIIALTRAVDHTNNEMRKTADSVHKVMDRWSMRREEKSESKQFSIELLQRKVEFTAYGLFPLDSTLVKSIVNMVVTYLVILFQFQIAGTKKNPQFLFENATTIVRREI